MRPLDCLNGAAVVRMCSDTIARVDRVKYGCCLISGAVADAYALVSLLHNRIWVEMCVAMLK